MGDDDDRYRAGDVVRYIRGGRTHTGIVTEVENFDDGATQVVRFIRDPGDPGPDA